MTEPGPEFSNSELIHLLDIVNQRIRHHHDALWKEEIHYTWLSYILVAGLIYILVITTQTRFDWLPAIGFFLLAFFLSIIGIFLCFWGFKVVRQENKYFHTALQIGNRLRRALRLHEYPVEYGRIFPPDELEPPADWEAVKRVANKCLGQLLNPKQIFNLKKEHKIHDLFQLTMLLPLLIFGSALIYSVVAFILYYKSIN